MEVIIAHLIGQMSLYFDNGPLRNDTQFVENTHLRVTLSSSIHQFQFSNR